MTKLVGGFVRTLLLTLSGCDYSSSDDFYRCHVDAFNSFCVVATPPGTTISTGEGIVPGLANSFLFGNK